MEKGCEVSGYGTSDNKNSYEVVICKGKSYKVTHNCAECGKALKNNDESYRIKKEFVVCGRCHQARKAIFLKTVKIFFVSIVIGLAAFSASAFLYLTSFLTSAVVAMIFTAVAFAVLSILLHPPAQTENIDCEQPVKIKYNRKTDKTVFVFKNKSFADAFCQSNIKALKGSDTFERSHIKRKDKSRTSMIGCMHNFTIKTVASVLITLLILLCFYPILSKWQTSFERYITNLCIYPECKLNRKDNLYYCELHKCLTEQCQRPIYKEGPYCHIHNGEE